MVFVEWLSGTECPQHRAFCQVGLTGLYNLETWDLFVLDSGDLADTAHQGDIGDCGKSVDSQAVHGVGPDSQVACCSSWCWDGGLGNKERLAEAPQQQPHCPENEVFMLKLDWLYN